MTIADKNDHNILDHSVVKESNFSLTVTKVNWHSSCLGCRQKDNKGTRKKWKLLIYAQSGSKSIVFCVVNCLAGYFLLIKCQSLYFLFSFEQRSVFLFKAMWLILLLIVFFV